MADAYFMYTMQLSWYSAKVRSYLRFKHIPFTERNPTAWEYFRVIPRHVGHGVVPVLVTPEGEWLQDSSVIIERMEEKFPDPPVVPSTPRQRFVTYLLELWSDEFWLPAGVHARWSFPENYPKWRDELAVGYAPGWPRFIQRVVPIVTKRYMQGVNRRLGATPTQIPIVERWLARQLDQLERHFAAMPYLLGTRPSLADFALAGPICGHLRYDESARVRLLVPRPHLADWTERMASAAPPPAGEFLAGDVVPESLLPLLESALTEMVALLRGTVERVRGMRNGPRGHLPRLTSPVQSLLAGEPFSRAGAPYMLWMAQRLLDGLAAIPAHERDDVRRWIGGLGGNALLDLDIPRVRRVNVHAALD